MPRKPTARAPYAAFAKLLDEHLRAGQRPDANNREPWTDTAFARLMPGRDPDSTGASPRTVSNWRKGTALPSAIEPILKTLFGPLRTDSTAPREALRAAYITARDEEAGGIIAATPPDPAGEIFVPQGDQLAIRRTPPPDDIAATRDPDLLADHPTAIEQAHRLADLAARRQNQLSDAWADLVSTAQRLLAALDVPTERLPESVLDAYRALVRLGSLLEQQQTLIDRPEPREAPLDAELFRHLRDTVTLIVPMLRTFPSVQRRDAAMASFWTAADLTASSAIIDSADRRAVVPEPDIELLREIEASARRTGTQAAKSKGHQVTSIRQLLLAGAAALLLNGYANTSPLVARVSGFFVEIEKQITIVAAGMSADVGGAVKFALERALEEGKPTGPLALSLEPASAPLLSPPWTSHVISPDAARQAEPWATRLAHDRHGTYADFTVPGTDITQRLRWIPPGSFLMGAPKDEVVELSQERPQHEVTFAAGFWMFDTTVTLALWRAIMGEGGRGRSPRHPVTNVSWQDAKAFLVEMNETILGLHLALPSEAAWEYACRAGKIQTYHFGDTISREQANFDAEAPFAVGSLPPNAWGLHEMHGNIWEWCEDTRHNNYKGAPDDGSAWIDSEAVAAQRVNRGGSYISSSHGVRSAVRNSSDPDEKRGDLGFRCVRMSR